MSTPFDPQWLEPRVAVPVDIETTAALVQELKRMKYLIVTSEERVHKTDKSIHEPVGYAHAEDLKREHHDFWVNRQQGVNEVPLYTAPPKREWVGLTDDDIWEVFKQYDSMQYVAFSKAIEARLKEKNGG